MLLKKNGCVLADGFGGFSLPIPDPIYSDFPTYLINVLKYLA